MVLFCIFGITAAICNFAVLAFMPDNEMIVFFLIFFYKQLDINFLL
jgi:hypothetical protein